MSEQAVRARAREAGLAVDWVDAMGRPQQVKTEALRRILDSLDATQDDADVRPLVTARVDARIEAARPVERRRHAGRARAGRRQRPQRDDPRRQGCDPARDRQGGLPPPALRRTARSPWPWRRRAASPSKRVGAGRRMWGVAAQVYGLRRAGDGGIGDAGAVRDLALAAARHGADAVALSPVHSLFAADPARHGPYSPSSRLFLNPLYGDPSIVFGPERLASHATVADEQAPLIDWTTAGAAKFAGLRRLFDDFAAHDLAGERPSPQTSNASCARAARHCASTRCSRPRMRRSPATGPTGRQAGVIRRIPRSRIISRAKPLRSAITSSCNGSPRARSPPRRRRRVRPA